MKVVSTSPSFAKYSDEPVNMLRAAGIEVVQLPGDAAEHELLAAFEDADAAIVGYTAVNQRLLQHAVKLQIVCKHGAGVDNIDLEGTRKKGIWVTNVPDGNKMAVADFTFGLMLSLARRIQETNQRTKAGEWPQIAGSEIYGKTLGVIGLGRIGKEVVRRAKGFDMNIIAYDPFPDYAFAESSKVTFTTLEEVMQQSDYVTLHMPLSEQTHHLIGAEQLGLMKSSAYLINVSRGGLIDEAALYTALKNGRIAGCALDVFEREPVTGHPLFSLANCMATPHAAGYTHEAITNVGIACAANIVNVLVHGRRPSSVLNGL